MGKFLLFWLGVFAIAADTENQRQNDLLDLLKTPSIKFNDRNPKSTPGGTPTPATPSTNNNNSESISEKSDKKDKNDFNSKAKDLDQGSGQGGSPPDVGKNKGGQPGMGGDGGESSDVRTPQLWIPICFMIPPGMDSQQVSDGVKGVVDGFGDCDIAVEPYIFRVTKVDPNPETQIQMAKTACDANKTFGVEGSAVQTLAPGHVWSDLMCKSFKKDPKTGQETSEPTTEVAGCSELGNGVGGGSSSNGNTFGKFDPSSGSSRGNYGGKGDKGKPAASGVDEEAWGNPPVWCHELGHSVAGPKYGGDYLVNEGEGKGQIGGLGLQGLEKRGAEIKGKGGGAEGGASGKSCNFTPFGCLSLRGGSNPNDGRHKWMPQRKLYFKDNPNVPPRWDLYKNQSFFKPNGDKNAVSANPLLKNVPKNETLVIDEGVGKKTIAVGTDPAQTKPKPKDSAHKITGTNAPLPKATLRKDQSTDDKRGKPGGINAKGKGGNSLYIDEGASREAPNNNNGSSGGGSGITPTIDKAKSGDNLTIDEGERSPQGGSGIEVQPYRNKNSGSNLDNNFFRKKRKGQKRESGDSIEMIQPSNSLRQTAPQSDRLGQ